MTDDSVKKLMETPDQEVAYCTGYFLRGINMVAKDKTWLMVVKLTGRLDGAKVAFIEANSYLECWEYLASCLYTNSAKLNIRPDKFA